MQSKCVTVTLAKVAAEASSFSPLGRIATLPVLFALDKAADDETVCVSGESRVARNLDRISAKTLCIGLG